MSEASHLQERLIEYLESKGWYFDWDHIHEVWDEDSPTSPNKRRDAIRTLHGWTVPQWGEYWSSDHLPPKGPKPKKRRYECMHDAIWSQLLREEEPQTYGTFFKDAPAPTGKRS